jgi:hypothetical protein
LFATLPMLGETPRFAAEVPLGDVSYNSTCEARRSSVGSNGHTFYGAWTFLHPSLTGVLSYSAGAALSADGSLLTPTQRAAAVGAGSRVVSNGDGYLVANDSSGGLSIRHLDDNGIQTAPAAGVTTGFPQPSFSPPIVGSSVAAAWNGTHYLVAGTVGAGSGTILHDAVLALTATDSQAVQTRLIADPGDVLGAAPAGPGRTLLLLLVNDTLETMLIDDTLVTTLPVPIATAPKTRAAVASNGSGFFVIWSSGTTINGLALDGEGLHAGAAFVVNPQAPINDDSYPDLTWDGSSYLAVWQTGRAIECARTNGSGAAIPFAIAEGNYPSLASNNDGDTIVLASVGCGTIDSLVVRRGALRTDSVMHVVSREAVAQSGATALRTTQGTQVIWYDNAMRMSFVDGHGVVTTQPLTSLSQSGALAKLIATPGGSAAAWPDLSDARSGVQVQQYDASGNPLRLPLTVGSGLVFGASIAALGDDLAVAYRKYRPSTPSGADFLVTLLGADGSLRQTPVISGPQRYALSSAIAAVGDRYLAVWSDESSSSDVSMFSAIVDRNASVLSKQLIIDDPHQSPEALVTNGTDVLLVLIGGGAGSTVIYAQRLDLNGTAIGTLLPLITPQPNISRIRLALDGPDYVITYVALTGDSKSTELRQITLHPDSTSSSTTLLTLPGANVIDSYALNGTNVASLVLRRAAADLETNGAARLYWAAIPSPHVRLLRNR